MLVSSFVGLKPARCFSLLHENDWFIFIRARLSKARKVENNKLLINHLSP